MGLLKKLANSSFWVPIDENLRSYVIRHITNQQKLSSFIQNYAKLVNLEV